MENEKNASFEDTLKEILRPEETKNSEHPAAAPQHRNDDLAANHAAGPGVETKQPPPRYSLTNIPPWVEWVVRIAAGLIGALLLVLFALQIAKR